jgi:exodeoxyribonuclease V gamma subunit
VRNSQLTIRHGNHLEPLLNELGEVLAREPLLPFERELIVVQSQGMRRWLTLELTRKQSVVANLDLPFPGSFCREICSKILGVDDPPSMQRDALVWRIFSRLDDLTETEAVDDKTAIRHYLNPDPYGRKRFQLAYRLAALFDDYQLYRHKMVDAWIAKLTISPASMLHEAWQADIFRYLYRLSEKCCLSQQIRATIEQLAQESVALPHKRISVFGVTTLPPRFIELLVALSWHIPVDIYFVNPCRAYWADLPTFRQRLAQTSDDRAYDDAIFDQSDSLLASFGRQAREFFTLLLQADASGNAWNEVSLDKEPPMDSRALLHLVQRNVLRLEGDFEKTTEVASGDHSISIHACHSPMREIEVLRDQLLFALHTVKDLQPHEIVVMVPDITVYAPYIQAVFGVVSEGVPALPFSIADRPDRFTSPITLIPEQLLKLVRSRATVSEIMDLLSVESVARKFSIREDELGSVRALIDRAGIRWGRDAAHRARFDLPQVGHATWRTGFDRLLLGYAMGDAFNPDYPLLPATDATNASAELIARLIAFFETIESLLEQMTEPRTLSGWAELLGDALSELVEPRVEEENRALTALHRACDSLRLFDRLVEQDGRRSAIAEAAVIADYFSAVFSEEGFGQGYIDGRITFCALKPMRSIPFRVVALCGMNESDFPRKSDELAFDLMAQRRALGDRDVRKDDRYLFLEAILAAEERLIISYVGQDPRTNASKPPSVCLSEFIDYLDAHFSTVEQKPVSRSIEVKHPLHAFSRRYFSGDSDLFTYSRSTYRAIHAARSKTVSVFEFVPEPLPPVDTTSIPLEALIRFWINPSDYFCRYRLDLHLREDEEPDLDSESFALDPLDGYRIGSDAVRQQLVRGVRSTRTIERLALEQSAKLPADKLGSQLMARLSNAIDDFVLRLRNNLPEIESATCEPVNIQIDVDDVPTRIVGTVDGVLPQTLAQYRFTSVKTKDLIRAWISQIGLAISTNAPPRAVVMGTDGEQRWAVPEDAEQILRTLVEGYLRGQEQPLPFFEYASKKYANIWHKRSDLEPAERHRWALLAAADTWHSQSGERQRPQTWSKSDLDDPAVSLCFGDSDPINTRAEAFSRWSLAFWSPYISTRNASDKE